ncbi:MAG: polysaccharide biosynthesis/export family protein [Holophagaceae bacterium]|nr:polysaccharide biosynthesis/export family protein [Holophagaceae bacterium]
MNPHESKPRASRFPALLGALSAVLLLAACRAPGMKMSTSGLDKNSTVRMNGQLVTLRPLNAQTVVAYGTPSPVVSGIDLLASKVEPYKVGPQDILLVTVWDHPEITLPLGQYRTDAATGMLVDEEGYFYFPYVGRIKVSGLTVTQVRDVLTEKLNRVLQRPQVDVKVVGFRSQKVYVGGEVRNPATYNVTDIPFTLSEAINRAGGFLPSADQSRLVLSRGERTWNLNFQDLLSRGNRIDQILLKDGDSLLVHNRDESSVYIMGEVRNPSSVPTHNGRLTLAQALSEAGGINQASADPRSVYVLRRGKAENTVDVFHLDAYSPVAMVMADRFALQPKDVIYVDAGTLVRWNKVLTLLLPSTSLIGVAADVKTFK